VGSGVGQPGKYRLSGVTKAECVWAEQNVGGGNGKKSEEGSANRWGRKGKYEVIRYNMK
jgi:hypothetical protein